MVFNLGAAELGDLVRGALEPPGHLQYDGAFVLGLSPTDVLRHPLPVLYLLPQPSI